MKENNLFKQLIYNITYIYNKLYTTSQHNAYDLLLHV